MSRKWFLGAAPVLAALALLVVTQTSQAQGFGIGGRNWGVGVGQPYYGGGYYGYGSNYYSRPWGSPYSTGWNSPYYGANYGYYSSPSYYSSTYSYPATNYYTTSDNSYNGSQPVNQGNQSFYFAQGGNGDLDNNATSIHVRLMVPPDAQVWFEDQQTQQRGMDRLFVSPPMTPGKDYVYHIKAQWMENGQQVNKTKDVTVHAGDWVNVDLLAGTAAAQNFQQGQQQQPRYGTEFRQNGTTTPQQYQFQNNPNQAQPYGVQQQQQQPGGTFVPGTQGTTIQGGQGFQGTTINNQGTTTSPQPGTSQESPSGSTFQGQGTQGTGGAQGTTGTGTQGQGTRGSGTTGTGTTGTGTPVQGPQGQGTGANPGSTPNRP